MAGNAADLEVILTSAEGEGIWDRSTRPHVAQYFAILNGQAECLRVICRLGLPRGGFMSECAAVFGNLPMLRLAHELGDRRSTKHPARLAASTGHIDCLAFALSHGYGVGVDALRAAVSQERLACVELLVAHGLPTDPYIHADTKCRVYNPRATAPFGPAQLRALQHILDKGRAIHPGTLILAARIGDVDTVRFLHSRGVGLWDRAMTDLGLGESEEEDVDEEQQAKVHLQRRDSPLCLCTGCEPHCHAEKNILTLPNKPQHAPHMWNALWYGWAMGAPLSRAMEAVFKSKRRVTRALLSCFHVAARLSRGEGALEQRAAWEAMDRIPVHLLEQILLLADLQIPETLRRPLPKKSILKVEENKSRWYGRRTTHVWVCAPSTPSDG